MVSEDQMKKNKNRPAGKDEDWPKYNDQILPTNT